MSGFRWLASWALYWAGDMVSRWNDDDRRFTERGYQIYRWLMLRSDAVQGSGSGPWHTPQSNHP